MPAEFAGRLGGDGGVGAGDDDRALTAWLVGPGEPDPDRGVDHTGTALDLGDPCVESPGRFLAGAGHLAGQQDRHVDQRLVRTSLTA